MVRLAAIAVLALLPAAAFAPRAPREVATASALEKLRPADPLPDGTSIDLAAARGECESAQVAVR